MYTLMIADDEIETRDSMIACIDWKSLDVKIVGAADNGISACETLYMKRPDIALIDIRMPGMDGLEVIRKAQEEMRLDTVFIILSGYDSFYYAQRAVELHVNQYLLKPFTTSEIRAALEKAFERVDAVRSAQSSTLSAPVFPDESWSPTDLQYPQELEHQILNCITAGQRGALSAAVSQFFSSIRAKDPSMSGSLHSTMMLYSAVCRILVERDQAFSVNHFSNDRWQNLKSPEVFQELAFDFCLDAMNTLQLAGNCNRLIQLALGYIDAHYSEKISLNLIAEAIHISPIYLSNLFTKVVGKSITEYLQALRIEHAKALMRNPQHSIGDIADMVGYSDVKYFVRIFKKLTGVTPNTFRNQITPGPSDG